VGGLVPKAERSEDLSGTVLVAGVGNLFFGDDGFGVAVAQRLAGAPPPSARVEDYGIRAIHLAFALSDPLGPPDLCIIADCMARGRAPGTLYVVEPDVTTTGGVADAHGMNLPVVFAAVRELGGQMPRTLIVGCEPASLEPGIGLSDVVEGAVPAAIEMIRDLLSTHHEAHP
jgi:hydrogenase maturation protease